MKKTLATLLMVLALATSTLAMSWGPGNDSTVNGVIYKTYLIEVNNWYIITFFDLKTDEPCISHVTKPNGKKYWLKWKEAK